MKYVDTMILDADEIQSEARTLQEQQRVGALRGTLEAAWRPFHESFDDDAGLLQKWKVTLRELL